MIADLNHAIESNYAIKIKVLCIISMQIPRLCSFFLKKEWYKYKIIMKIKCHMSEKHDKYAILAFAVGISIGCCWIWSESHIPVVLQIGVLTDYDMLNMLDVAHLQLYFVSIKKESCLPLYIVPGSHKIDERVPPYW
jgi:uncharacterized Fe-S center protein